MIALTLTLSTGILIGSTIYLNTNSDSGGPVHWHADIEFWACGNEIELRDPTGFSNKIGTGTLHEHDDHRIHLDCSINVWWTVAIYVIFENCTFRAKCSTRRLYNFRV